MPFIQNNFSTKPCFSAEHLPPMNIVLPPGEHQYQCHSCGKLTVINVPDITYKPDYAYDYAKDSRIDILMESKGKLEKSE